MNPAEVRWSRNHFDLLALNAIWGVPRSGLIFKKVSQFELQLVNLMPWSKDIGKGFRWGYDAPPSEKGFRRFQQADFETLSERFTAAGIKVTDPRGLLKD
jgi:hypothetical protein